MENDTIKQSDESTSVVGRLLRKRREQLGWDIPDISAQLRIRAAHLKAIEAGRMDELPGVAYTIGFVRAYADHLGMEGKLIVADFREEMAQKSKVRPLEFPPQPTQGRLPGLVPIGISLVICLFLYMGWYYWNNQSFETGNLSPIEPVPPSQLTSKESIPDPNPSNTSSPSPQVETESTDDVATTKPADGTNSQPTPALTSDAASTPPASPVTTQNTENAVSQPTATAPKLASQSASVPLRLFAKLDSWVDIRDANNQVVFSRVLRQGENYDPPLKPGLTLTTGNAGGLDIILEGNTLPSLGGVGIVARGIPLDVQQLKAGQKPAATTSSPSPNSDTPDGTQEPSD